MLKKKFLIMVLIGVLNAGASLAQGVPAEELTSPQKTLSCSDLVTAQSVVEGSELAFTGKIVKRNGPYAWFQIYAIHNGEYKEKVIKTAGFHGGKHFIAGSGQSFDVGEVYTVAVRRKSSKHESNLDAEWFNALDSCSESVVTKAHDRYGLYRLTPEQLEAAGVDALGAGPFGFLLLGLVILLGGLGLYKNGDRVLAFIDGFRNPPADDEEASPQTADGEEEAAQTPDTRH